MKKEIILILFIFLFPLARAGYLGISPAMEKIYFEPGLRQTFSFSLIGNDNVSANLYLLGDLAGYANLSVSEITGQGSFEVILHLPQNITIPGHHKIIVGAKEGTEISSGIGGVVAIQAVIDVFVQYPGKYAEATFSINNANEGEVIPYEVDISNLGYEDVDASISLDIYSGDSKVMTINKDSGIIKTKDVYVLKDYVNNTFKQGRYNAVLSIDYGNKINMSQEFTVGSLLMNITDYSYEFTAGKINKFLINVQSLWNSKINDIYAAVTVSNNGKEVDSFRTPSVEVDPLGAQELEGFFNAESVPAGKYTASITVYYENKTSFKLASVYVNPASEMTVILIGVAIGALILGLVGVIVYLFVKLRGKNGKKSK